MHEAVRYGGETDTLDTTIQRTSLQTAKSETSSLHRTVALRVL